MNAGTVAPDLQVAPQLWQLHQADACEPWPVSDVDLIVTSPPYALDMAYAGGDVDVDVWPDFMTCWLRRAFEACKESGRLALNVALDTTKGGFRPMHTQAVMAAQAAGWTYRSSIVWNDDQVKRSIARGSVDSHSAPHIFARVEMVSLFHKGKWCLKTPKKASDIEHQDWLKWTNGLWPIPPESRAFEKHKAAFPEELPHRLVHLLSGPGDLVVDPFVGSGTTVLVAVRSGRRAVGFDIRPEYVERAKRRLVLAGLAE